MQSKITVLTLCAMLLVPCSVAEAQQTKKIPRIGFLIVRTLELQATMLARADRVIR
jgi:hypothetical protein